METSRPRAAFLLHGLLVLGLWTSTANAAPYNAELFVRGSFNDWHTSHLLKYEPSTNRYLARIELAPGVAHRFKIASADWSTVDLGSPSVHPGDDIVELGVPEPLTTTPGYGDLTLTVPESAVYSFTLDPTDPANPTLTVAYLRPGGDGAQHFYETFGGFAWYFDCIGQTVWAEFVVRAMLQSHANAAGGMTFIENLQTDGVAWDSAGHFYDVNAQRPFRFSAPASGAFQFNSISKIRLISRSSAPDLWVETTERLHIDADGNVVRYFYFDGLGCRK
jgi:hypothetical protein